MKKKSIEDKALESFSRALKECPEIAEKILNNLEEEYGHSIYAESEYVHTTFTKKDLTVLSDAVLNLMGAFDNPVARRFLSDFQKEAVDSGRKAKQWIEEHLKS